MSAFDDAMRPHQIRHCSSIDQQLAFLRAAWQNCDTDKQIEFEKYVRTLAQIKQPGNIGHASLSPLRLDMNFAGYDDEGNEIEGDTASLTPKVILAAIAEWRQGNEYTPKVGIGFNHT